MMCPYCLDEKGNGYATRVLDTRSFWEPTGRYFYIERRRQCKHCHQRFTTTERSPVANPLRSQDV